MLLRAPASGTVAILVAEVGEAVVPGEPVLTLIPDNASWFGFSLREDALRGLSIGSAVAVHSAARPEPIEAKVVELRNWGEFATWRAARATGDHDLNMLFLRLDPTSSTPKLEAGQTVWFVSP
jgi:HlyD family secretion protein